MKEGMPVFVFLLSSLPTGKFAAGKQSISSHEAITPKASWFSGFCLWDGIIDVFFRAPNHECSGLFCFFRYTDAKDGQIWT
jgi:hypothetical protein